MRECWRKFCAPDQRNGEVRPQLEYSRDLVSKRLEWQRTAWASSRTSEFISEAHTDPVKANILAQEKLLADQGRKISANILALSEGHQRNQKAYERTLSMHLQRKEWKSYQEILAIQATANQTFLQQRLALAQLASEKAEEKVRLVEEHDLQLQLRQTRDLEDGLAASIGIADDQLQKSDLEVRVTWQNLEPWGRDEIVKSLMPWVEMLSPPPPPEPKRKKPLRKKMGW